MSRRKTLIKKANSKFNDEIKKLQKEGRGKDVKAIAELAKKLDVELKKAKSYGKKQN